MDITSPVPLRQEKGGKEVRGMEEEERGAR